MTPLTLLILGTQNPKKGGELSHLLAPLGIAVQTLAHYPDALDVSEDGDSFAANAEKKATAQAHHLGQWVLGEDSGICVDALQGAPESTLLVFPVRTRPIPKTINYCSTNWEVCPLSSGPHTTAATWLCPILWEIFVPRANPTVVGVYATKKQETTVLDTTRSLRSSNTIARLANLVQQ